MSRLIDLDDLPSTAHAHEFTGAEHGDVPFSIILVHRFITEWLAGADPVWASKPEG